MNIFFQFFVLLRESLRITQRRQILSILVLLLSLILCGTITYAVLESWTVLEALYATVITITTVGYGDFSPVTNEGRIFAIGFSLIAISLGGYAISTFAVYTVESSVRKKHLKYRKRRMKKIDSFDKHYILCGTNLIGTRIAQEFMLNGVDFVVIDDDDHRLKYTLLFTLPEYFQQKIQTIIDFDSVDLSKFEDMPLEQVSERAGVPYIKESATDDHALIQAGIERAAGVIAVSMDDRDNLSTVIGARSLAKRGGNDDLKIMANVNDPFNMRKMYLAGADYVRTPSIISGTEMATHMMHPEIGNWWYTRMGVNHTEQAIFRQEIIHAEHGWGGMSISDVHREHHTLIVSVKRGDDFVSPPRHDFVLQANDVAIMLG